MKEKKIVVPEGMIHATMNTLGWHPDRYSSRTGAFKEGVSVADMLEAALQWLRDNPILPTMAQMNEMYDSPDCPKEGTYIPYYLKEWQRRMFLAPEPEPPEEIKALLVEPHVSKWRGEELNEAVLEAFRRGQQSTSLSKDRS